MGIPPNETLAFFHPRNCAKPPHGPTWCKALVTNVQKTWVEYPQESIERSFQNLSLVHRKVTEHKGGNHFEIPHLSAEERAQLPGYQQF